MKPIIIEIKSERLEPRELGKMTIYEQEAWIEMNEERRRFTIGHRQVQDAYKIGKYNLDIEKQLDVGQYGSLELRRFSLPTLVPLSKSGVLSDLAKKVG